MTGTSRVIKILSLSIFLSISILVSYYHQIFPVVLTRSEGFLLSVPTSYWAFVSVSILVIMSLNYIYSNRIMSLISTVYIIFLISFPQFFFFGLLGRDYTLTPFYIIREFKFVSREEAETFQWPLNFIFHDFITEVSLTGVDLVTEIEFVFALYIIILGIGMWNFLYYHIGDPAIVHIISVFVFGGTYHFHNFQYVSWFFAVLLILFLYYSHHKRGVRWTVINIIIFMAIVFTHKIAMLLYLGSVLVYPIVGRIIGVISKPNADSPIIIGFLRSITTYINDPRLLYINTKSGRRSNGWLTWTALLFSIYIFGYLFHFIYWQTNPISRLTAISFQTTAARYVTIISPFSTQSTNGGVEEIGRNPQYYLLSEPITNILTDTTFAVIMSCLLLIGAVSLCRRVGSFSAFNLSIFLFSVIWFLIGTAVPIKPTRVVPIAAIALAPSLAIMSNKTESPNLTGNSSSHSGREDTKSRLLLISIVVLVILLSSISPVIMMNQINNASISGGGNAGDYYTEKSGLFLMEVGFDNAIQASDTNYPFAVDEGNSVQSVQGVFESGESLDEDPGTVVQLDYRLYHYAAYMTYGCNFGDGNVVYSNSDSLDLLYMSEGFVCQPT